MIPVSTAALTVTPPGTMSALSAVIRSTTPIHQHYGDIRPCPRTLKTVVKWSSFTRVASPQETDSKGTQQKARMFSPKSPSLSVTAQESLNCLICFGTNCGIEVPCHWTHVVQLVFILGMMMSDVGLCCTNRFLLQ